MWASPPRLIAGKKTDMAGYHMIVINSAKLDSPLHTRFSTRSGMTSYSLDPWQSLAWYLSPKERAHRNWAKFDSVYDEPVRAFELRGVENYQPSLSSTENGFEDMKCNTLGFHLGIGRADARMLSVMAYAMYFKHGTRRQQRRFRVFERFR